ncbi:MAG: hypothetical protein HQ518_03050 [Rhodopirellula sp.]|nr:hypothetical protein [Rhodopirellula sp.]
MVCHTANLPFMTLLPGLPTRVQAVSSTVNSETYSFRAASLIDPPDRKDWER